ncbi:hypothetical protein [Pontibacter roseus]|uniref:hypothetical protein n=1 Tax=Pontibacter roseus TaxID=336989 RepID=UPI00039B1FC5|nr:hypothetical protein [Pontibacter roseus]
MRKNPLPYFLLPMALLMSVSGCQQKAEEESTLASTHPKLEESLQQDSLTTPVSSGENTEVYQRYRLRMDAYQTDQAYRVEERYKGPLAPLDETTHADAAKYRTALQEGLKQGVNFAGQYTVVTVGCGTTCQEHYVVDSSSGKLLDKLQSSTGASYTPESRIFIVNPPDSSLNYVDCPYCEPEAYVFDENGFRKLPKGQ